METGLSVGAWRLGSDVETGVRSPPGERVRSAAGGRAPAATNPLLRLTGERDTFLTGDLLTRRRRGDRLYLGRRMGERDTRLK